MMFNNFLRISGIALLLTGSSLALAGDEPYQQAAQQLQQRLGKVLMHTIKTEGHVAAIRVCNEQAPQIAQAVGSDLNLEVGRTALRVRNPKNAPTARQRDVLQQFVEQWQHTKNVVPTATYTNDQGQQVWVQAIVMQPQCAACHGSNIEPALKQAIVERYPEDAATNFEVGQIRGAFVVKSSQ